MKSLFILLASVFFTSIVAFAQQPSQKVSKDEREIRATLESTAIGWNEGNLQKYLADYTPEATEMLPTGPKGGVNVIEQTMRQGFWRTGRPLQNLHYESVEVRMLGKKYALVTGQYVLSGGEKPDRTGWFTTVWIKTKMGWRVMHDHS